MLLCTYDARPAHKIPLGLLQIARSETYRSPEYRFGFPHSNGIFANVGVYERREDVRLVVLGGKR